jgi:hypothetical protein
MLFTTLKQVRKTKQGRAASESSTADSEAALFIFN